MAKLVLLGIVVGIFIVIGAVLFGWKIILVPALLVILVAPFATSGKGDRNYRDQ